ncbi:MAG: hypothetical protein WCP07_07975 [bacterium]|jgi:hypothetical protein
MPETISCNHPYLEENRGITPGATAVRLSLCMTQEEADALLHVLLHVAPSHSVTGEMVERILMKVADLRREFARPGEKTL